VLWVLASLHADAGFGFVFWEPLDTKLELDLLLRGFLGIAVRFIPVGAGLDGFVDLTVTFIFVVLEAVGAERFEDVALLRAELLVSITVSQVYKSSGVLTQSV